MTLVDELTGLSPEGDTALTVGVFDGVHLGHRYLLSQLREEARRHDLLSGVITFNRHPLEVLSPQTQLSYLTDLEQRIHLLRNEGVDIVAMLTFSPELAQLSAREFVGLLIKHLRMRALVIGPDFALGREREGDVEALRTMGQEMGFSVTMVPPKVMDGEVISSTAIRNALAAGDVEKVHKLIGRLFDVHGRVVPGEHRGTGLGFPTANLDANSRQALPPDGVYATWAHVDGEVYPSATNIGRRPTFGGSERIIEVFVFDYNKDLYGREMKIDLVERLRDEKKFDTVEDLKEKMKEDVENTRNILDAHG